MKKIVCYASRSLLLSLASSYQEPYWSPHLIEWLNPVTYLNLGFTIRLSAIRADFSTPFADRDDRSVQCGSFFTGDSTGMSSLRFMILHHNKWHIFKFCLHEFQFYAAVTDAHGFVRADLNPINEAIAEEKTEIFRILRITS